MASDSRSVLEPHAVTIRALLDKGKSLAVISDHLKKVAGIEVTRQTVGNFVTRRGWEKKPVAKEDMSPPLVKSWLALGAAAGKAHETLLAELNTACGTHYKASFLFNLQSGAKGLERAPAAVRNYMMAAVLSTKLLALGVPDGQVRALVAALEI